MHFAEGARHVFACMRSGTHQLQTCLLPVPQLHFWGTLADLIAWHEQPGYLSRQVALRRLISSHICNSKLLMSFKLYPEAFSNRDSNTKLV